MFEKDLQSIGLTEGESKVYETLLLIGTSTVGPIVKRSEVAYSNIYEILDRLMSKGLVSYTMREKTKYFQASVPGRLYEYLDRQEAAVGKNRKLLDGLVPRILNMKKFYPGAENAEVFVGNAGMRTAYETLFENGKKGDEGFFFYAYSPEYHEYSRTFYSKLTPRMRVTGIKWRGIVDKAYFRKAGLGNSPRSEVRRKYVDFPVPGNIDVFKEKSLITTWSDKPVGVLIISQEVADNFKTYFDAMWKAGKG